MCVYSFPLQFLFLDVAIFCIMIGVAFHGIDLANDDNSCLLEQNSSVECENSVGDAASTELRRGEIRGANNVYLHWMAGATVCGVIWALVNAMTLIGLSEFIRAVYKTRGNKHNTNEVDGKEMNEFTASTSSPASNGEDQPDSGRDNIELVYIEDKIGAYQEHEWLKQRFRHFFLFSGIGLFLSSLSYICALLCLLWGVAVAYDHTRKATKHVSVFVGVEFLTAILLPIFLFVGTILFAIVLDFITVGHLDMRIIIPRFMRHVQLESGEKSDYWVIDDTIYYPLKKKNDRLKHKYCFYSIDRSPATWFLTIIVCTAFHIAISIFVDVTLDRQITVNSCDSPLIDRSFDCFNDSTLNYVDCVNNTQAQLLHCFKFFRFGIESDFVSAISAAYFIFLSTMAIFSHIYFVMRNLLRIKPSRYWGIGFCILGALFYITSIIVALSWFISYAAPDIPELQQINIIHIAQFFMVSTLTTIVGLFLLVGKWYEKLETKAHAAPVTVPLVSYTNTERKYIHEVQAKDTW